ncbi:MAG: PAS domain S-box protein [Chloroflexi bacterium]|nr:PAS domain S-box protein [Chloroflexota bacterium]
MMLVDWLESRRQEIVAVGLSYEQEEAEPLADGTLYPLWDAVLDNLRRTLCGQLEPTAAAERVAQQAQELHLELPTFIRSLDTLRRAAQFVLGQEAVAAAGQSTWLAALNDSLFLHCRVASTMLGSGALARLTEERHLLRTLIDTMPDLIWAKDRDSNFLILNRMQAKVMGVATPEDAIGKNDFAFFPQADAAKYRADEVEVMESGLGKVGYEERVRDADGNIRWMQATKMPFRDSQGNIVGIVGIVRDITEIKEARDRDYLQQQVIEAQKQALAELSTPAGDRSAEAGAGGTVYPHHPHHGSHHRHAAHRRD